MLYQDIGMQSWESVGGCQRKHVITGITLWKVAASAHLPLEHALQTLFVINGSGKLCLGARVFIACPGILLVLSQSDEVVAMPSKDGPFMMLQITDVPQTSARRADTERAATNVQPAEVFRADTEQHLVSIVETTAETAGGTSQSQEVTKKIIELVAEAKNSLPAPSVDPSPPTQAGSDKDRISQEAAAGESPLIRYLASGPVSGHIRRPVTRSTRE